MTIPGTCAQCYKSFKKGDVVVPTYRVMQVSSTAHTWARVEDSPEYRHKVCVG